MALDEVSGVRSASRPMATPVALPSPRLGLGRVAKRLLDLVSALVILVPAALPMLAMAVAVRISSPGPVLFRQPRVGMNGRLFTSYKFRSMYIDAENRIAEVAHLNEAGGPLFKSRRDPRITPLGRLLRRSSLDELAQLFNVLRGEMSMVGPRPGLMSEVLQYEPHHLNRLTVRPGLTGLWQVSGRSELPFQEMMRLDMEYIARRSLWFDAWLLLRTVPAVLSGRGAF